MAQPVMYAAWCRALLAIQPFGMTARAAARAALAPLLALQLLVASPVALVIAASPISMSAPIAYPETRRVDVVD